MSTLGAPLGFPLGGGYLQPFIVNLSPRPDESNTGLTGPVRFSVRDVDSYVVAGDLRVAVGYAQVHASGSQEFDEVLPRTLRTSVLSGAIDLDTQPTIALVGDGVRLTKTTAGNQRGTYATSIDAGTGVFDSSLVMADIRPNNITNGGRGAVLGMEYGPRNTGVYLFFERSAGIPRISLCGPADEAGTRVPNTQIAYDWSGLQRYIIIWNETQGRVEVYSVQGETTNIVAFADISTFQTFTTGGSSTPRRGGQQDVTAFYGIEGNVGDQVTFGNVAVTMDVGFPIIGLARPGNFYTTRRSDETVRYEGGDPTRLPVSPWFKPDDTFFSNVDPNGVLSVLSTKAIRVTKTTSGTSFAVYREEPGFLSSDTNGFMVEGEFFATTSQILGSRITGMGFMVFDGQSVFYVGLLSGSARTAGLLRGGGSPGDLSDYVIPGTNLDWSSKVYFRLTVDPRRGVVELFGSDLTAPLMSLPFVRGDFPSAADFGLLAAMPFIAFGHTDDLPTQGSLDLSRLTYAHTFQSYAARDGDLPDDADPVWAASSSGFSSAPASPLSGLALLGGGFGLLPLGLYVGTGNPPGGTAVIEDGQLVLETDPSATRVYRRSAAIDNERGAIIEARLQITSSKPRNRTGFFLIIDDALRAYMLSFVDTEIGKFVGICTRYGSDGHVEQVGTEGLAAKLSKKLRWDLPHTYRLERRPLDGLYLFVDGELAISIPDTERVDYPTSQFSAPTVAFGHISDEGCVSVIDFVNTAFSSGYEISIKKVETTEQLEQNVRDSQAVVVAYVEDNDPGI
jgi:hypothetical protein